MTPVAPTTTQCLPARGSAMVLSRVDLDWDLGLMMRLMSFGVFTGEREMLGAVLGY